MARKIFIHLLFLMLAAGCATKSPTSPAGGLPSPIAPTSAGLPAPEVKTAEPTFTPIQTGAVGNGSSECNNPFYPVRNGATWIYTYNQQGATVTYRMSVDKNDAFVLHIQADDDSTTAITIDGQCTDQGVVLMDNLGSATTITDSEGKTVVSTIQAEGVTLPKDIKIGDQWSQTLETVIGDQKSVVHSEYTALGYENISVPAGNFYTLKVEQSGYVEVYGQKVEMHGYQWFAEGVGTVKSEMEGTTAAYELVSYNIPN